MQFVYIRFLLSLLFVLISSTKSVIPIRMFNSHRNRRNDYTLDEKHQYQLLQIINKPYISILDVDFMRYRPPYLKEFCKEITRVVIDDSIDNTQSEKILGKIATKFKETVYTEVNFPYTYRLDTEVRIDNDELLTYRKKYCDYKTKEEIRESKVVATFFVIILMLVIILFHKM